MSDDHLTDVRRAVQRLRAGGAGWRTVAAQLNAQGIPTPSGRGRWDRKTAQRYTDPVAREAWNAYMRRYRRGHGAP